MNEPAARAPRAPSPSPARSPYHGRRCLRAPALLVGLLLATTVATVPARAGLPMGTNQAWALNVNWAHNTWSGWGGQIFNAGSPTYCKPPNNYEVRAKWRVRGARGARVTIPYVVVTIQTSRRLQVTGIWMHDRHNITEARLRTLRLPVIAPGSRRTFRVPFRRSFEWMPSREVHMRIRSSFGRARPPQRIWHCRVSDFLAGLKRRR
jgi:hypothetical protein